VQRFTARRCQLGTRTSVPHSTTTKFGDLDLSFEPAGTGGYAQLSTNAVQYDLGAGLLVPVAALEDIIRSKEAANRAKDRQALPTLRLLLEKRAAKSST
jgi:hypothetical protein